MENQIENQTVTTKSIAIKFGVLLGLISIVYNVVLYVLGKHLEQNFISALIGIGLMVGFITYGINQFKKANGNLLSLGQALKTGVGIAIISALLSVAYTLLLMYVIEPDMTAQILEKQQEAMLTQNPNMTQEQIDTAMSITEKFSGPVMISTMALIWSAILGFIISLIAGLVLKKEV